MVSTLLWILGQWSPQSLKLSHFEFIPQQFCLGTFEKVTAQSPVERLRIILLIGDKCLHISRLGQRQCRGKHSSSHQLFASFSREKSFVQSDSLVNFGVLYNQAICWIQSPFIHVYFASNTLCIVSNSKHVFGVQLHDSYRYMIHLR